MNNESLMSKRKKKVKNTKRHKKKYVKNEISNLKENKF